MIKLACIIEIDAKTEAGARRMLQEFCEAELWVGFVIRSASTLDVADPSVQFTDSVLPDAAELEDATAHQDYPACECCGEPAGEGGALCPACEDASWGTVRVLSCKETDAAMRPPFIIGRGRRYRNGSGLYACPRCHWLPEQPPGIPYGAPVCPDCHAALIWPVSAEEASS
jgi:hypothetical protein